MRVCHSLTFEHFLAVSPVFRKVDNLSEEESAYHKKISRVQQGLEGKVAGIMKKLSFFTLSNGGLKNLN